MPTDWDAWDQDQRKKTEAQFGAKNKKESKQQKQYDLLMQNQVDFVQSSILDGVIE